MSFPYKRKRSLCVRHSQDYNQKDASPQGNVKIRDEWTQAGTDNHDTKQAHLAVKERQNYKSQHQNQQDQCKKALKCLRNKLTLDTHKNTISPIFIGLCFFKLAKFLKVFDFAEVAKWLRGAHQCNIDFIFVTAATPKELHLSVFTQRPK